MRAAKLNDGLLNDDVFEMGRYKGNTRKNIDKMSQKLGLSKQRKNLYWHDAQNNKIFLDYFPARSVAWVQTCRF